MCMFRYSVLISKTLFLNNSKVGGKENGPRPKNSVGANISSSQRFEERPWLTLPFPRKKGGDFVGITPFTLFKHRVFHFIFCVECFRTCPFCDSVWCAATLFDKDLGAGRD